MQVGDIVKLKTSFMGEQVGTLAYVYWNYGNGVSIITENGEDIGGFSEDEYHYLEFVKKSGVSYNFKSVIQLSYDKRNLLEKVF